MSEESDEPAESDIRRRAAWLLVMLALVAGLIVYLMTTFFNSSSSPKQTSVAGLDSPAITTAAPPPSSGVPGSATETRPSATKTPEATSTKTAKPGPPSCPSSAACVLDGDAGNGVAAINAYRAEQGLPAVPGTVSTAAQACALANGSGCSGGWAETQLAELDGTLAVNKILAFGKLTDPGIKSIQVGWAYDPASKQVFFALVRVN